VEWLKMYRFRLISLSTAATAWLGTDASRADILR